MRRLLHWGPIGAMSIVGCISISAVYCHLMWWPPSKLGGILDLFVFLTWVTSTLTNLMRASFVGPGHVPAGWRPEIKEDEKYLQYCEHCRGFKAPRAHHCRQCGRCVMKMDHHCPWINNCCGHMNHGYFIAFLLSAIIGCIHASVILAASVYWAFFRVWYVYYGSGMEPKVYLGPIGLLTSVMAFGLAVGVVVAVGFLFIVQIRSVIRNRTSIEDYIVTKAKRRPREDEFVYPYDLGWKKNLREVLKLDLIPSGNGIIWPVTEGCDQYTLTREQIEQKRLKRMSAVEYRIIKTYNGNYLVGGCGVFFSQPFFTGEPRLHLQVDDIVLVTHQLRNWLYGEKLNKRPFNRDIPAQRGWFPRKYGMELDEEEDADESKDGVVKGKGEDENPTQPNGYSHGHRKDD